MYEEDERLWALVKDGKDRVPLLTPGEADAAMRLLWLLSRGDGEGSDVAYHLAEVLEFRLDEIGALTVSLAGLDNRVVG